MKLSIKSCLLVFILFCSIGRLFSVSPRENIFLAAEETINLTTDNGDDRIDEIIEKLRRSFGYNNVNLVRELAISLAEVSSGNNNIPNNSIDETGLSMGISVMLRHHSISSEDRVEASIPFINTKVDETTRHSFEEVLRIVDTLPNGKKDFTFYAYFIKKNITNVYLSDLLAYMYRENFEEFRKIMRDHLSFDVKESDNLSFISNEVLSDLRKQNDTQIEFQSEGINNKENYKSQNEESKKYSDSKITLGDIKYRTVIIWLICITSITIGIFYISYKLGIFFNK